MAGNGYDDFFRQAQKASGVIKGEKSSAAGKNAKTKFNLNKGAPKKAEKELSPEDRLRLELASRLKKRRDIALNKRRRLPIYPVACSIAALLSCAVGYHFYDEIDSGLNRIIAKVEIGFLGSASAAEPAKQVQEKTAAPGAKGQATNAPVQAAAKEPEVPNVKQWSPEEISFFSKLSERKKELDLRESELNKLEEELQKRKAELDERLKQLEVMRDQIAQTLKTRVASDQQKVEKLVEFYSTMKPQQAATVIETLNEDLAVEVLDRMKKKNAAEVLNMMDAKKARRLSELLTGYQRSTASETAEPTESPKE